MHRTPSEASRLAGELVQALGGRWNREEVEVVVCPAFPSLPAAAAQLGASGIALGAQDLHWEAEGAYTGEVSAGMLVDLGCRYVIVGHSERRTYLGESDEQVARKVRAALAAGLHPIVCVGESASERERGETEAKIGFQVLAATALVSPDQLPQLVVAYEPLWAIGTGRNADGAMAQAVCRFIRDRLEERFGSEAAREVRILYGGSVKPDNIGEFAAQPDIDGALVGGASLQAASFSGIVAGFAGSLGSG